MWVPAAGLYLLSVQIMAFSVVGGVITGRVFVGTEQLLDPVPNFQQIVDPSVSVHSTLVPWNATHEFDRIGWHKITPQLTNGNGGSDAGDRGVLIGHRILTPNPA